jgi:hypothetical protein
MKMVNLDEYKKLEKLGIYFHYSPELYDDGCNLNFSIEFKNYNTQTGWYNDNHEFGDVYNTMIKSIQLAYWYLEDPKRMEMIDSGYDNPDYTSYQVEVAEIINLLIKDEELTYIERYKLWFSNNYETGMEYNPKIVPDFDNDYYTPTPKFKNK